MTNLIQNNKFRLKVILEPLRIEGNNYIKIKFPYDELLVETVRQIKEATYNPEERFWYIINKPDNLKQIFSSFNGIAWVDSTAIFQKNTKKQEIKTKREIADIKIPEEFEKLLIRKRYSPQTIKVYKSSFIEFLSYYATKKPEDLTESDIRDYQDYLVNKRKISISTQNQAINAIKFYYEQVLKHEKRNYWIDRPKKGRSLPNIISEQEVLRLINATNNLKHKCIIVTLYSSGVRISELLNLRIQDISFDKSIIFVKAGKGKKDRITILSHKTAVLIKEYLHVFKPKYWLFEGPRHLQYSSTSINSIIKKSALKAGITKKVTAHTLRHSFATHLMEQGVDTLYIQKLLGHNSPLTTAIYAFVSKKSLINIISPFDRILEDITLNNNKLEN
ncbi:MAG: site-specific integrase [Bacteroidetes bacterium]|jgi:integrase/recombinase XerD|nr:site-specific integrase [Bacteroidota bacterium]MBT5530822.1 site-specific integrase [Cytophagia bacterium]MBT3423434.1 site-specific integrase [Bacteroidota bacterium]MBT3802123.1 site-specific integrase [Bacteroidota bacterium]MBT3933152.1 site-specific integrase [Bacteroidota bacterium]